jgi:CelD/BcsL family acetyltransferase involved in cellulose biosynthesis
MLEHTNADIRRTCPTLCSTAFTLPMSESLPTTTDFHLEVLDSAAALRAIAEDWDDLWRRSDVTMPTLCAEPAASWIETFAPDRQARILTVRQGTRLVGALPVIGRKLRRAIPIGDVPLNQWSANGDLLIDTEAGTAAVAHHLAEAMCNLPWPLLWFQMVPWQAGQWTILAEKLAGLGARVDTSAGFDVARTSLNRPFDTYFADRPKNLRRSVRKDLKRIESKGRVELRLLDELSPDEVEESLRRAFAIEDSGWKGEAGTSVLRSKGIFEFYLRQAKYFARRGVLRLAFLECDGKAIAFEVGWIGKGVYHSFKVGYDEDYRKFGPGHLLRGRLIEAGCSDPRLQFVDFQGPVNQALRSWATEKYPIGRLAVCPPRFASRAILTGLRTARCLTGTLRHAATWLS